MNINEYRQGLMDLAGNGLEFSHVFHKVQDAVSTIRLVESKGKDVKWLKDFYEFAMSEIKKDMTSGQNHFKKLTENMTDFKKAKHSVCNKCGSENLYFYGLCPKSSGYKEGYKTSKMCLDCLFDEKVKD